VGGLNFLTPDEIRAALAKMEPREPQHEPYMAAWWDEYICPVCTNNDISNPVFWPCEYEKARMFTRRSELRGRGLNDFVENTLRQAEIGGTGKWVLADPHCRYICLNCGMNVHGWEGWRCLELRRDGFILCTDCKEFVINARLSADLLWMRQ